MIQKRKLLFIHRYELGNHFRQCMIKLSIHLIRLPLHNHTLGLGFYQTLILFYPHLQLMIFLY